jgi:hypothetical protein
VVLEGAPRAELTSFASELTAELRAEPAIGQVTERLDPRFFLERAYLLMSAERLDRLGSLMSTQGRPLGLDESLEKAMAWLEDGPRGIDLDTAGDIAETVSALLEEWQPWLSAEEVPTGLDWNRLLARHGVEGMADGYFAARDGRMVFLFVRARNASQDFEVLGPFIDWVKAVAAATAAKVGAAGRMPPQVGLTGLPASKIRLCSPRSLPISACPPGHRPNRPRGHSTDSKWPHPGGDPLPSGSPPCADSLFWPAFA